MDIAVLDWVPGDMLGIEIPAHSAALRAGGPEFLTRAFRATGAISPDNSVSRIVQFEECPGGSTGRKLWLSVAYEKPEPGLHRDLFVKFSRDFTNEIRDRARRQMESEVRFAALSRMPGFPIAVARCYLADYHHDSGTGILITERIHYGQDGIEPHYEKCLDYEMPSALEHYQALVKALGRLAGTHKAGKLPESVASQFPFDARKLSVSERPPYSEKQLQNRIARYADFAKAYPQLLPDNITSDTFIRQLALDVVRFPAQEQTIRQFLHSRSELVALCHWNANIDNAWFWRESSGRLQCGLLDWGHVSQMNVAMALWGCLAGAEPELWNKHLDFLLSLFATEFVGSGGPPLDIAEMKLHLCLYAALMGLAWLLDAPPLIKAQIPDLAETKNRFDPRFRANETARTQLHMMTVFLNLWQTQNFGTLLDRFLARAGISA